jgi:glucose/arabinose dehydrogenase
MAQKIFFNLLALCAISSINAQTSPVTTAPWYGQLYGNVAGARALVVDSANDILVLSRGNNGVMCVYETENGDGTIRINYVKIVNADGLGVNHGLTFFEGFVYVSSQSHVYRWPYTPGSRTLITTPAEIVIRGMPIGGHTSRTLIFDPVPKVLYVSVGSDGNVDPNSDRARIRRFNLSSGFPSGGIDFNTGEVFADGLRNEVGLAWDNNGVLWGVENGADQLNRPDLGGDIHNGNPAEELNRFNRPAGTHYGYPYCFSTHNLPGYSAGTQFAWPSFMNDGVHTDEWCRNPNNNQPPVFPMPAHQAPLGIEFYDGRGCGVAEGAPPCSVTGDAFVAFHGSWNSDVKVGYRVAQYPFDKTTLEPTGQYIDAIFDPNVNCGNNCFRPVNVVFNNNGHLIVSTDSSHEIFRLWYGTPPPRIRND